MPIEFKKNVYSSLFLLLLFVNTILIITVNAIGIKIFLVFIQGLLFVGILEAIHQATHLNLFTNNNINKLIGTLLGVIILIHFVRYRYFHAYHHAYTSTDKDPEKILYSSRKCNSIVSLILAPYSYYEFVKIIFKSKYTPIKYKNREQYNSILFIILFVPLCVVTYIFPVVVLLCYWIPLFIFTWTDFMFNQSEHYGSSEISNKHDAMLTTNDIIFPKLISVIFLFRNYHRTHHVAPLTPWFMMPDEYHKYDGNGITLTKFILTYFKNGPRLWGVR